MKTVKTRGRSLRLVKIIGMIPASPGIIPSITGMIPARPGIIPVSPGWFLWVRGWSLWLRGWSHLYFRISLTKHYFGIHLFIIPRPRIPKQFQYQGYKINPLCNPVPMKKIPVQLLEFSEKYYAPPCVRPENFYLPREERRKFWFRLKTVILLKRSTFKNILFKTPIKLGWDFLKIFKTTHQNWLRFEKY